MQWDLSCAAVIPCRNEARFIGALIQALRPILTTILVVDDGSTDGTHTIAAKAGAVVLRHEVNQGKGAALATGLSAARERGLEWAILMDGDGQHAPADIPKFFAAAEASGAKLVIGSRMHDLRKMPWVRRLVNWWMSRQLSKRIGTKVLDSQSGFRLIHLTAWQGLKLNAAHFEVESEMLVAMAAAGHKIDWVPIQVIYRDEETKIRPVADTVRWFRWWRRSREALARPQKYSRPKI